MPLPCPPDVDGDGVPDPVPGTHQISLLDIQNEFGGTYLNNSYTRIDEYYRGGEYVADIPENEKIPSTVGQQISFADFFCSVGEYVIVIGNSENVKVKDLFGSFWSSTKPKRLIVAPGAVIGPSTLYGLPISNPNGYAMTITNDFVGTFTLDNRGFILGAGGRAGGSDILSGESRTNQNNGGSGGNAIFIGGGNNTVRIRNLGEILAGGGGGGAAFTSGSSTQNYSYQGGAVTISLTANGAILGGGLGRGYKQNKTNSSTGTGASSYNISFSNSSAYASQEMYYPPNSSITITNNNTYTRNMYFGSGSSITINQISAGVGNIGSDGCIYNASGNTGICGFLFSGRGLGGVYLNGSNSTISFNLNGSGVYKFTKDPNQSYSVNGIVNSTPSYPNNIYMVDNVSGGGPQQASGYISLNGNWGSLNTAMPVATPLPGSTASPGVGGDWGQSGGTSTSNITGGASGYAVVNANSYANWISYGTVTGSLS